MYALNTKGQELWNYSTAWYLTSSPVIANDTIYFGSWDWSIHSISLNKGEQIWSTQPERSPVMSYFASGIIVDKTRIFLHLLELIKYTALIKMEMYYGN